LDPQQARANQCTRIRGEKGFGTKQSSTDKQVLALISGVRAGKRGGNFENTARMRREKIDAGGKGRNRAQNLGKRENPTNTIWKADSARTLQGQNVVLNRPGGK